MYIPIAKVSVLSPHTGTQAMVYLFGQHARFWYLSNLLIGSVVGSNQHAHTPKVHVSCITR